MFVFVLKTDYYVYNIDKDTIITLDFNEAKKITLFNYLLYEEIVFYNNDYNDKKYDNDSQFPVKVFCYGLIASLFVLYTAHLKWFDYTNSDVLRHIFYLFSFIIIATVSFFSII